MNQYDVKEFPKEVFDKIQFYVYRLIDPRNGETFYVGKGKGNRVFQHMKLALKDIELDDINDKVKTIRSIRDAGLNVIHVIHRHGMDEKTALNVEGALIDAYPGATNIAGGNGNDEYGTMNAIEIIDKYSAAEAVIKHKVLMILIHRTLADRGIYDATRFAWKINIKKAEKADYILAVKQGIIQKVFIANKWKKATTSNFPQFFEDRPGRYGFIGIEAPEDIQSYYCKKRVPSDFRKKGASNPIKYNF